MDRSPPTALETRIAESILAFGPIGIDAFMAQALYDPKDGYYITGKPLGAHGDFTTAPEISQIYGELVGLWLAQSWIDLDCPAPFQLIELGPGQGTLMADILRVGAKVPGFLTAAKVHLVESNKHFRTAQVHKLAAFSPTWHENLGDIPQGPSLIVGNEFLDCLPIRQFVKTDEGWREKQVGVDGDQRLAFGLGPILPTPPHSARDFDPIGAVREAAPPLESFVHVIQNRFDKHVGRALLIDYTDSTGRAGDTLQALYRQAKTHPLDQVGASDLTAHVDFHALLNLAKAVELTGLGPISQAEFLRALGIEARAKSLIAANPHCANDVQVAVERLIGEAHMGALFCVVCLDSPHNEGRGPPIGF